MPPLLVDLEEIPQVLATHLSARELLRFLSACKGLHEVSGIEVALGKKTIQASRALAWHIRFSHRFVIVSLDLIHCSQTAFTLILHDLSGLRELTVRLPGSLLFSLEPVAEATGLRSLALIHVNSPELRDVSALGRCSSLRHVMLNLKTFRHVDNLGALGTCGQIRSLELRKASANFSDELARMASAASAASWSLEMLCLQSCNLVTADLAPLPELRRLRSLDLSLNAELASVGDLGKCAELRALTLTGCTQLKEVAPLSECASLETLYLTGCKSVADVSALASCVALRTLHLNHCSSVRDASGLGSCSTLELLNLRCSGVEPELSPAPNERLRVVYDTTDERRRQSVGIM